MHPGFAILMVVLSPYINRTVEVLLELCLLNTRKINAIIGWSAWLTALMVFCGIFVGIHNDATIPSIWVFTGCVLFLLGLARINKAQLLSESGKPVLPGRDYFKEGEVVKVHDCRELLGNAEGRRNIDQETLKRTCGLLEEDWRYAVLISDSSDANFRLMEHHRWLHSGCHYPEWKEGRWEFSSTAKPVSR